eukprot:2075203-Rhodomonas_salina.1
MCGRKCTASGPISISRALVQTYAYQLTVLVQTGAYQRTQSVQTCAYQLPARGTRGDAVEQTQETNARKKGRNKRRRKNGENKEKGKQNGDEKPK